MAAHFLLSPLYLYSRAELAHLLHISVRSLGRRLGRDIAKIRTPSGRVLITREAAYSALEAQRRGEL